MSEDKDDLLGGPTKKPETKKPVAKVKTPATKSAPAAKKAPAAPAKKAPAAATKPAKAKARNGRGEGKFYFPKDSKEFTTLKEQIVKRVTVPIKANAFAKKHNLELFKVRLAGAAAAEDGLIKMGKTSGETGLLTFLPKGFKGKPDYDAA